MKRFFEQNGIACRYSPPYQPSSYGHAEWTVEIVKDKLIKLQAGDWHTILQRILFELRTTPTTTTQESPAELLMGRKLNTIFDRLHPSTLSTSKVETTDADDDKQGRHFSERDHILLRKCGSGPKYISGELITKEGPVM
ncbi:hypothetical protein PR048_019823 [Dryococelus australis]|uniref:Integrase catalytic domain-containing protein n=1 Tax=Dryococelus australis TaxID=614101 RepID=A0ABQ9H4L7_9NEOP|nr:hypothetical protein PR048_019823 [Dryococelus australis]